jgi:trehalose 6-phosphate synthase
LVQDYHFALAPKMIRERLPRPTIITFWHIPWPNAERMGICPWREELIDGLLGSSIVGFHTQQHCNNFLDSVDAFMESRIDRETTAVVQAGHGARSCGRTRSRSSGPCAGSDDPARAGLPARRARRARPRAGRSSRRRHRSARLHEGHRRAPAGGGSLARTVPELRGRFVFLQIAAPSRTKIGRYKDLNDEVERLANEINARWGTGSYQPVVLLRRHHDRLGRLSTTTGRPTSATSAACTTA